MPDKYYYPGAGRAVPPQHAQRGRGQQGHQGLLPLLQHPGRGLGQDQHLHLQPGEGVQPGVWGYLQHVFRTICDIQGARVTQYIPFSGPVVARYLGFVVESFWGLGGGLSFIQEKELGTVGESYPGAGSSVDTINVHFSLLSLCSGCRLE